MTRFLLRFQVRSAILVGIVAYLGCSAWGISGYRVESLRESSVLPESYFSHWRSRASGNFDNSMVLQFVTIYEEPPTSSSTERLERFLLSKSYLEPDSLLSWRGILQSGGHNNSTSALDNNRGMSNIVISNNKLNRHDFAFSNDWATLAASRVYIKTKPLSSNEQISEMKKDLEEMVEDASDCEEDMSSDTDGDDCDVEVVMYSPELVLTDSPLLPLWEVLKFAGVQGALCLVLLLMCYFKAIFGAAVLFSYMLMAVGIFGLSHFLGIYMTQVPMVSYVAGLCYLTEVTVHVFYAFAQAQGTSQMSRVNQVLGTTCQAVFHAMLGQFLGLLVLLAVRSYVFVSVFIILTLASAIGLTHAVFFVPTMLSCLRQDDRRMWSETKTIAKLEISTISQTVDCPADRQPVVVFGSDRI